MKQSRSSGFTLVELLIFIGLFSVILLVLSSLFSSIVQQQLENQGMSSVETDSAYLLSRFAYDVGRADAIVTPVANGETSQVLVLEINGQQYEYSMSGDTLQLTTASGGGALTSNRTIVSNLQFQKIGNESGVPTVQVRMTLSSRAENSTGRETATINTTFGLR